MSGPAARRPFPLPGPVAIFVVVLGVLLYAAFLSKGPWDSDYYWHVTTGELIANGQFPRTDPFSFTWGGMPWTLHEWLSELLIFRLVDGIGYMGAVYVFAFMPGIAMAILAFALHRLGLRTAAVVAAHLAVGAAGHPVRDAAAPGAVLDHVRASSSAGSSTCGPDRARWILVLPPLFIVWANLHGLWVIGLVVLAVYTVLSLVGLTPMSGATPLGAGDGAARDARGRRSRPEGPSLLLYPLRYVDAGDWGMANISEWQSPDFHDPAHWPLLIFMAATAIFGRWRVPWWMSILSFLGIAMTLIALRNGAVAAIMGAPGAGGRDRRRPARLAADRSARHPLGSPASGGSSSSSWRRSSRSPGWSSSSRAIPRPRSRESIERELPVQGVELLLSEVPDGRILSWYGWGGYVIGTMYDHGARVFVDGRNDMYDDSILEEYNLVRGAEPGWEEIPDRYEVDAMVFPPFEAISKGPAVAAGWCEAYRDDNEVVFLRTCD